MGDFSDDDFDVPPPAAAADDDGPLPSTGDSGDDPFKARAKAFGAPVSARAVTVQAVSVGGFEDDDMPPPPGGGHESPARMSSPKKGRKKPLSAKRRTAASKVAAALMQGPPPQALGGSSEAVGEETEDQRRERLTAKMRRLHLQAHAERIGSSPEKQGDYILSSPTRKNYVKQKQAALPAVPADMALPIDDDSEEEEAPKGPQFAGWASDGTAMMALAGDKPKKTVSSYCGVCGGPITGKALVVEGQHYHPKCFVCKSCGLPLKGGIMTVNGSFFHPGCVVCEVCKRTLTQDQFVLGEKDGKPYCVQHAAQGSLSPSKGPGSKRCQGCLKPILVTQRKIGAQGRYWHQSCFVCFECRQGLEGKQAIFMQDKVYCPPCVEKKYTVPCHICKKNTAGMPVCEVQSEDDASVKFIYHPTCFRCKTCNKSLKDQNFYQVKGHVYCFADATKLTK